MGKEGSVYGQITTVNNLARPFAGIVYEYAASFFKMSQNDLKNVCVRFGVHVQVGVVELADFAVTPNGTDATLEAARVNTVRPSTGVVFVVLFVSCLTF
ncbi:hypothetical protein AaE_000115 [Aphanomyces astaci]|uniref:Uncharacterized protein n=1 Tax=Aphanomyces astaci TaxID=112090 RepID=A0A6A5B5G9_APHAT|nr:hypothetical protein AaE_000115 [Aphanomyces astaci]